jgi:hypothetical protein
MCNEITPPRDEKHVGLHQKEKDEKPAQKMLI